uniref:ARID domain-containing protein n=1 Tax=Leersia perrieri TaxID=77586 RepID=A0A0D9VFW4_9ORYZ
MSAPAASSAAGAAAAGEEAGATRAGVADGNGKGKGKGKGKEKVADGEAAAVILAGGGGGGKVRYVAYPARMAEFNDVVEDAALFKAALKGMHVQMGTKLKVPIIGGKDLDLHKLFKEVTSRGGLDKVKADNRWREIPASFNFPPTATNASFMLKKYYFSLLYHFEQLYLFEAQGSYQEIADSKNNPSIEMKDEGQASQKRKRASNSSSGKQPVIMRDIVSLF